MDSVVREYCNFIDNFSCNQRRQYWLVHMEKLLPQLHTAVLSLNAPDYQLPHYELPDDDQRCELFMRINNEIAQDNILWSNYDKADTKRSVCESLADDFTDIYFDLKSGLELLEKYPSQPHFAYISWRYSFYVHWGQHLVDAEKWLHAVEARNFTTVTASVNTMQTVSPLRK